MDLYQATSEYRCRSRQSQTLKAIDDFRYLAPAKLGLDEAHERMLTEATLRRLLKETAPAGRPQLLDMVRQRLGSVLILIGTSLQSVHAVATTVPAASDPGSAPA
jgi:hypothetical protein